MIKCVCTLTTGGSYNDLVRLLTSISLYCPMLKIYLLCDSVVMESVLIDFPFLNIICHCILDKYMNKNRRILESEGRWLDFMLEKCTIIDYALEREDHVLFVDSDIILLNGVDGIEVGGEIGLSRHEIVRGDEDLYGKFNGGFIYVRNKSFTGWWRSASVGSSFYEQKAMDNIPRNFDTFYFPPQNNFGWWRLCQAEVPHEVASRFKVCGDTIMYDNKPLNSVHTHIGDNSNYVVIFNNFIESLIKKSNNLSYKRVFSRM